MRQSAGEAPEQGDQRGEREDRERHQREEQPPSTKKAAPSQWKATVK